MIVAGAVAELYFCHPDTPTLSVTSRLLASDDLSEDHTMTDSLSTIFAIVVHAPIWVWALYALLLILGLQRTRDRTVSIWRELILPVVVTPLAISNLIGVGLGGLPTTLVALAIGATVGWWLERDGNTRRLGMAGFGCAVSGVLSSRSL